MTSHTESVDVGLLRRDGRVESCEDQDQLAAHGVTFRPRADELTCDARPAHDSPPKRVTGTSRTTG